jgi:GMP synthase-like glutamine amidotransferase
MPTCLVVQHVAVESAFSIDVALRAAGVAVETCRVFDGDDVPLDTAGFDGVVVMGGPMSVNSTKGFPSREAEVSLLADALRTGIPTLGVCLGAQLLAVAAGGTVAPNAHGPKIGWAPIQLDPACQDDLLLTGLPPTLTVLHWHGESFEVPPGARPLISGTTYPNQAFRIGDVAWGVQFHLEVTAEAVDGFLHAFAADTVSVPGGAEAVRAATPVALNALAPARDLVCSRLAGLVAARVTSGASTSTTWVGAGDPG